MSILIINGSPKLKNSASAILIDMFRNKLTEAVDILSINFKNFKNTFSFNRYDKIIIVSPLYADGLPSHLLESLTINEQNIKPRTKIYGIVNCGLIEGIHAKQGLDIIKNFALRCKSRYCGGIGIGGCGGLHEMQEKGILKLFTIKIRRQLTKFAEYIQKSKETINTYTKIGLTRVLYKIVGNLDWKKRIKRSHKSITKTNTHYV